MGKEGGEAEPERWHYVKAIAGFEDRGRDHKPRNASGL